MTSKHSTGGGHSASVGRAGGLGEPERRAGEREQNPPDDSTEPGSAPQGAGPQEQTRTGGKAEEDRDARDDREARDASMQQGGDRS